MKKLTTDEAIAVRFGCWLLGSMSSVLVVLFVYRVLFER